MLRGDDWQINAKAASVLRAMLGEDEECEVARGRSWVYSHRAVLVATGIGAIASVGVIIWQFVAGFIFHYFVYILMGALGFPAVFLILVVQGLLSRKTQTWVAVTSQRVIQWESPDKCLSVAFERILACSTRTNYFMLTKEIELQVTPEQEFHTTTISRQSPFKIEYIDGLQEDRELIERMIIERIPQRRATSNATSGGGISAAMVGTIDDDLL